MQLTDIHDVFAKWNQALQTGDPKQVTALYAKDAILLPTVSNKVRHNHAEIEDYFVHFCAKGPIGKINEANTRILGEFAINSGVYTFTLGDGSSVQARYTFVYQYINGSWLIIEHHSSAMPE